MFGEGVDEIGFRFMAIACGFRVSPTRHGKHDFKTLGSGH